MRCLFVLCAAAVTVAEMPRQAFILCCYGVRRLLRCSETVLLLCCDWVGIIDGRNGVFWRETCLMQYGVVGGEGVIGGCDTYW